MEKGPGRTYGLQNRRKLHKDDSLFLFNTVSFSSGHVQASPPTFPHVLWEASFKDSILYLLLADITAQIRQSNTAQMIS